MRSIGADLVYELGLGKIEAAFGDAAPPGQCHRALGSERGRSRPRVGSLGGAQPVIGSYKKLADRKVRAPQGQPGVVLDWQLLTSATDFVFKGDVTYFVKDLAVFSGTKTVIEGGTVVKFTNSTSGAIAILSPIDCQTSAYRPAVFRSYRDDTVGEKIPGSDGNPGTSYYGMGLAVVAGSHLRYLRFAYADTAIRIGVAGAVTVSHCQFVKCRNPLWSYVYTTYNLRNVLFHNIDTLVQGDYLTVNGAHMTVHQCNLFASTSSATAILDNSLLVSLAAWGNISNPMLRGTPQPFADDGQVFQTVLAGSHYLMPNSPHRDAGMTQFLDQELLAEIRQKTTYPPVPWTAHFTSDQILEPRPIRDVNAPDRGFHYDPLEYFWTGLNLANATLTLTNGVAVCMYGVTGLNLQSGAKFYSGGTPLSYNRLVRYQAVQEQPVVCGTSGSVMRLMQVNGVLSILPEVRMSFTDVSLLSDLVSKQFILYNSDVYRVSALSFTDCLLRGGCLHLMPYLYGDMRGMTVAFTNSLIHRANISLIQGYWGDPTPMAVYMCNNLVYCGAMLLQDFTGTFLWGIYDSLFARVNLNGSSVEFNTTGYNRFSRGERYFGTDQPDQIGKMGSNGLLADPFPWITTLTGETHRLRGSLYVDQTGVFNHDLIVVTGDFGTDGGGVWRINGNRTATKLVDLETHLEGVITVPNNSIQYGPWAGKILAGAENDQCVYTISADHQVVRYSWYYSVGEMYPEDIDLIPANQDLYICYPTGGVVRKISSTYFTAMVGDILITQSGENVGEEEARMCFWVAHWNGADFEVKLIDFSDSALSSENMEHVSFAPISLPVLP